MLSLFALLLIIAGGCKQKTTTSAEQETKTAQTTLASQTEDTAERTETTAVLPDSLDFAQDISQLSLQDLRILRTFVYARHALHIMEADMNAYFNANTDWYSDLIHERYMEDEDSIPLDYSEVNLSEEEAAFVARIEKRIKEIQETNFVMANKQRIGNVKNIVNLHQFESFEPLFMDKIQQNNFVIVEANNQQLFHLYEENDYRQLPNFITTDLFLQAFHMYFSYTLKSLEQQKFSPILADLCLGLYNASMQLAASETDAATKNMADFSATFYAIPYHILTNSKPAVPSQYQEYFLTEIENINDASDNISEFLSFTDVTFPYSLFKPRGHYTRKPELEAYFKAMMWLQLAPFCLDNEEHVKQTILSAHLLNATPTKDNRRLINLYAAIYEPVVFLVGLPDNLSVMDIANYLVENRMFSLKDALSAGTIRRVNGMLTELAKTRNEIRPRIEISCPDKINFMPQRYLIDNDVLQHLVDVMPNAKRAYPKGIDVFAAFGSEKANDLLANFYKEGNNWSKFTEELGKMKKKFGGYTGWNSSVYNKWIESLVELQKKDKSYPAFMQTDAWSLKNMNTSLASWAELKHDAILYAEQPFAAECGGGGLPDPIVKGYIEPNIKFWNKLDELVKLTDNLLEKHGLQTPDLKEKASELSDYTNFLLTATRKELAGEELSENEYRTIEQMGSSIEYFTLSVIDPDLYLDRWELVQGPDKSIAVVADIYTRNVPGCNKNGILHVATGNANNIYVVVEIGGFLYLTRGATFSYYEFVEPLDSRLTDEEWQQRLEEKKAPRIPEWMDNIIIGNEPKADDRVFYSSGC